ncbi:MAG TPA: methyltransferase [Firmicutes bacterium]|nr:methyltransferase [Bacillota bacterium]
MPVDQLEVTWRLAFACLLGGLIGLERERHGRPAGFRTHILVSLGAALVMILSIYAFPGTATRDPARLAAQVVSGIGFLGAGTIMREGATIKGLTTAASLWVVSAIGLAVGSGFYLAASITTALVVSTLFFLDRIERRVIFTKTRNLVVISRDRPGQLGAVASALGRCGVNIKGVDMEFFDEKGEPRVRISLELPPMIPPEKVLDEVSRIEGVYRAGYEG